MNVGEGLLLKEEGKRCGLRKWKEVVSTVKTKHLFKTKFVTKTVRTAKQSHFNLIRESNERSLIFELK